MRQQRGRRHIQVNAHSIHRILNHRLKRPCKRALINIVLILANTDRLRFDLYQLRQRIL